MHPGYSLVTLPSHSELVLAVQSGAAQLVSWPPKGLRLSRGEKSVVVELSMLDEGREAASVVMLSSAMMGAEICIFSL